jgi:hypothetical protein
VSRRIVRPVDHGHHPCLAAGGDITDKSGGLDRVHRFRIHARPAVRPLPSVPTPTRSATSRPPCSLTNKHSSRLKTCTAGNKQPTPAGWGMQGWLPVAHRSQLPLFSLQPSQETDHPDRLIADHRELEIPGRPSIQRIPRLTPSSRSLLAHSEPLRGHLVIWSSSSHRPTVAGLRHSGFVIHSAFGFRHSSFPPSPCSAATTFCRAGRRVIQAQRPTEMPRAHRQRTAQRPHPLAARCSLTIEPIYVASKVNTYFP